jgi:hypothetical protein
MGSWVDSDGKEGGQDEVRLGSGDTEDLEGGGVGDFGEAGLNDLRAGSGEPHPFGLGVGSGLEGVEGDTNMIGRMQAILREDVTLGIGQAAEQHAGVQGRQGAAGSEITGDGLDGFELALTVLEEEAEGVMGLAGMGGHGGGEEGRGQDGRVVGGGSQLRRGWRRGRVDGVDLGGVGMGVEVGGGRSG